MYMAAMRCLSLCSVIDKKNFTIMSTLQSSMIYLKIFMINLKYDTASGLNSELTPISG